MVEAMAKLVGVHETDGNNHNFITEWYGMDGPWCDMTISYAAYHSGNAGGVCFGTKHAYTVEHAERFAEHNAWHPMTHGVAASGIRRGDIVFFDWSGGTAISGIDHVGLVESVSGSVVHTIEGNVSNVCQRLSRTVESIAGYGRPVYAKPPTEPPAPPSHAAGKYEPFPGTAFFRAEPNSPIITRMGKRLVAEGCGVYTSGPGPQWTDADRKSYGRWQRKDGFGGLDADGWPGKKSWDDLKVPRA